MKSSLSFSRLGLLLCLVVLAIGTGACAANESATGGAPGSVSTATPAPPPPTVAPAEPVETVSDEPSSGNDVVLAGLPEGTHLGISAFSPPAPAFADEWTHRWNEANDAASVGRVVIDWIDIEPTRGDYQLDELTDQLADVIDRGQLPMLTIAAVDISGTSFPEWLGDFDPAAAASAYNDMVDEVKATLERHGVWLFAVANEPPFDEGLDRVEFARFVRLVNDHVDDTIPGLATTFVFAGGDAFGTDPATQALHDAVDVLAINHYCLEPLLVVTPLADTEQRLQDIVTISNGRPVVFQEFGCPAAESMGSSEAQQAEWFQRAFAFIADEPAVRAAFVFDFQDWSQETIELDYGGAFDDEPELAEFAARFEAWLRTTGLFRDDMTPRPAYQEYLDAAGQ